jgi:tetratricopeptide (TPR) repeat protein
MSKLYPFRILVTGTVLFFFAIGLTGQSPEVENNLRQQYLQANDLIASFQFEQAQKILSECYVRDPKNIDYLSKIAYCNFQMGRYPDAKMFYRQVLVEDSVNTNALSTLGTIYEREQNYRNAETCYLKLLEIDTTNSYYYKRNGYTAMRLGKTIEGIEFFLLGHQVNEADIEIINQLCQIYLSFEELGFVEQMLGKGLALDPQNIKLLQNKSRLHQKKKEHALVVESIEKTMIQGDTSDYYQMMLGVAYLQIDSIDLAILNLEHIVQREKASEYTHHYLGLAYRVKEDIPKSIEHLEKAIELGTSPKMPDFHADLASIHESHNEISSAIKNYKAAVDYGNVPEHLFHLARLSDKYYKDKSIALKHYRNYLKTGDDKFKKYTEDRIDQLKEIIHFRGK